MIQSIPAHQWCVVVIVLWRFSTQVFSKCFSTFTGCFIVLYLISLSVFSLCPQYKQNPEMFKQTARLWSHVYAGAPVSSPDYTRKIDKLCAMGFDKVRTTFSFSCPVTLMCWSSRVWGFYFLIVTNVIGIAFREIWRTTETLNANQNPFSQAADTSGVYAWRHRLQNVIKCYWLLEWQITNGQQFWLSIE